MIKNSSDHLLFIEPQNLPSLPIHDEYVEIMIELIKNSIIPDNRLWYRGVHTCTGCKDCRVDSTPFNIILPSGHITNSLCIHYLIYHRDEVPKSQLDIINKLKDNTTLNHFKYNDKFNECIYGLDPFDRPKIQINKCTQDSIYNSAAINIAKAIDAKVLDDILKHHWKPK